MPTRDDFARGSHYAGDPRSDGWRPPSAPSDDDAPDPYGPDVNEFEAANRMKKATAIATHLWREWRQDGREKHGFGDFVANMKRKERVEAAKDAGQNPPGESGKTWVVVTDLADRIERRADTDPFARFQDRS